MAKKLKISTGGTDNQMYNSLEEVMAVINQKLQNCPDIKKKKVYIDNKYEGYFIFASGLVDKDAIQRDFISKIIEAGYEKLSDEKKVVNLPCHDLILVDSIDRIISEVLSGGIVFVCDGIGYGISCNYSGFDKRSTEEPAVEKNLRGSHEGFIEDISTNISIMRRTIRSSNLKFRTLTLGSTTNQKTALAYIDGIADRKLVEKLYNKLKSINYDGLLAIGYIEQAITDSPSSIFPQYQSTERPDKVAASLLEGKIAVFLDGTPVVLIAPVSFMAFFQGMEDYSTLWIHGTFQRLLRLLAIFLSVVSSALYVAITSFHYYAIPLSLLIPLAESRARVPFPPVIEVIMLEITVELVREAAIRLPTYIGTSISVVAGLIIGQAAVEAGIVSNLLIIVVSISAISSYTIPSHDMSLGIRILKFGYIAASAIFGIMGIIVCIGLTVAHLVSIESLSQPYAQPLIPLKPGDMKDTFARLPLNLLKNRPAIAKPIDKRRGRNSDTK